MLPRGPLHAGRHRHQGPDRFDPDRRREAEIRRSVLRLADEQAAPPWAILYVSGRRPWVPTAGAGASIETRGVFLSSQAGYHLLAGPSRCMIAGTSIGRTMKASRRTAPARPRPSSLITSPSPRTNPPNTVIMMRPAAVMIPPVSVWSL